MSETIIRRATIEELLKKRKRMFIIPLDHPLSDTLALRKITVEGFLDLVDDLEQDGYIFNYERFTKNPYNGKKSFFVTVGEYLDGLKYKVSEIKKHNQINAVTIFLEVKDSNDFLAYDFYKDYVKELKENSYFVMAMAFPENENNCNYQHIIDIVKKLGCDAIKTDYFEGMGSADFGNLKLFVAGGPVQNDTDFEKSVLDISKLGSASYSFGRNIFEIPNYRQRIKLISDVVKEEK